MSGNSGFLVVSRRAGQAFRLLAPDGSEIIVRINEIDGKEIKLAVRAPKHFAISKVEGKWYGPDDPAPGRPDQTSGGHGSSR